MGFFKQVLYSMLTSKTTREAAMLDELEQLKKELKKLNKIKAKELKK